MRSPKILFLSPYPFGKAPSQRLKFEQYYTLFEDNGFELQTSSFIDDDFWEIIYKPGFQLQKIEGTVRGYLRRIKDLWRIRQFDIVYIHLWVTPLGPPIFEWLVKKLAKKITVKLEGKDSEGTKVKKELVIQNDGKECVFEIPKGIYTYEIILTNKEIFKKGEYKFEEEITIIVNKE